MFAQWVSKKTKIVESLKLFIFSFSIVSMTNFNCYAMQEPEEEDHSQSPHQPAPRSLPTISTDLTSLSLRDTHLTANVIRVLAQCQSLRELDLENNELGNADLDGVSAGFQDLKSLKITYNLISSDWISTFIELLAEKSSLTSLNLKGNHVGKAQLFEQPPPPDIVDNKGLRAILSIQSLRELNLERNFIDDSGAIMLAETTSLSTINLANNNITTTGANAFSKSTSLRNLNLNYNKIEGFPKELIKSTSLVSVHLVGNTHYDQYSIEELQKTLESNEGRPQSSSVEDPHASRISYFGLNDKPYFMGLSIDGGGIRGLIPGLILQHLEEVMQRPLYKVFDCIAGTSVGGILGIAIAASEDGCTPLTSTSEVVKLFSHHGEDIFPKPTFMCRARSFLKPLYSPDPLERLLKEYFKNSTLDKTLTDLMITGTASPSTAVTFERSKAKESGNENFYLYDIARATSAAPTYFPAATIQSVSKQVTREVWDGGLGANNPSLLLFSRWMKMDKNKYQTSPCFLSIGTGKTQEPYVPLPNAGIGGWVFRGRLAILNAAMETSQDFTDQLIKQHPEFIRLQPPLYRDFQNYLEESPPHNAAIYSLSEAPLDCTDSSLICKYTFAAKCIAHRAFGSQDEPTDFIRFLQENTDRKHPQAF